jgi:hypothetical protein
VKINEENTLARRRSGKELVEEMRTKEEKKALVINMAKARRAVRARFLVVGIFLSMLTISTKLVIDSMKKIWKFCGNVDMCPLKGRHSCWNSPR